MDFVDNLFAYDVDEVVIDDDLEESKSSCVDDCLFKGVYDVVGGLVDSFV
jgi:hypothetical protein